MPECLHCKTALPSDAQFCTGCGQPLEHELEAAADEQVTTVASSPQEQDEKQMDLAPLPPVIGGSAQPAGNAAPTVTGTSQLGHVPSVHGSPPGGHVPTVHGAPPASQSGAPSGTSNVPGANGAAHTSSHVGAGHGGAVARAIGKGFVQKALATTAGKIIAVALVVTVVATSGVGVALTRRGSAAVQQTATVKVKATPTHRTLRIAGIVSFPLSTIGGLGDIVRGPDGNLWFNYFDGSIGRITPGGASTNFRLIDFGPGPVAITAGPDGNLWVTWYGQVIVGTIERITPGGRGTTFKLTVGHALAITSGPDGNLWFTARQELENLPGLIGRITPRGKITMFSLPAPTNSSQATTNTDSYAGPQGITAGPDGNVWFTDKKDLNGPGVIGRITPAGQITEYPLPVLSNGPVGVIDGPDGEFYSGPEGITPGPDGNLWFTDPNNNRIGRITPGGKITEFPVPTAQGDPIKITAGPDGNLWFTELNGGRIGRITPDGKITEFSLPTPHSTAEGITAGPDGNLWLTVHDTSSGHNSICRITFGK